MFSRLAWPCWHCGENDRHRRANPSVAGISRSESFGRYTTSSLDGLWPDRPGRRMDDIPPAAERWLEAAYHRTIARAVCPPYQSSCTKPGGGRGPDCPLDHTLRRAKSSPSMTSQLELPHDRAKEQAAKKLRRAILTAAHCLSAAVWRLPAYMPTRWFDGYSGPRHRCLSPETSDTTARLSKRSTTAC